LVVEPGIRGEIGNTRASDGTELLASAAEIAMGGCYEKLIDGLSSSTKNTCVKKKQSWPESGPMLEISSLKSPGKLIHSPLAPRKTEQVPANPLLVQTKLKEM
jgi:hypothetical protein